MRLVVADDAALLREGLVGLLERQGHQVLAQAASAPELEAVVDHAVTSGQPPDVVLTDVRMPPTMTVDGLDAAVRIRARHPGIGIMVLSQYVASAYATELFDGGAGPAAPGDPGTGGLGYLLKERVSRVADFLHSLQIVAAGGVVIDPEVASLLVLDRRTALDALSPREREVLELMARGLSNAQIAQQLVLSAGAVSKHVANLFTKLDLPPGEENRRVRAVLAYLTARG
ncbi:LuxR C-terminal-related transcriptional regulator [Auraticoccus monumenti]|uniref:DNA-binding response regulator, NarL/FixJ family, contains REC and HTH domains n=1 Tax=Auraticoccus monumenti TaxID=675864 RepID=A0A1G7A6M3_9ACTN|nr:response regulator transcription factor [Auraticoccus monumenti]SDE10578.1 DNA-binding response regulator, NarL/FixJ family, contains REC and HTH domains [Auraticoccus monumenti]